MPSLPLELILIIFQLASIDEDEECENSYSPAYWSWPLRTLEVLWTERMVEQRIAWNESVRLRLVCRAFNDLMSSRMRQSAVLKVESSQAYCFPRNIDASNLRRLKIFTDAGCCFNSFWNSLRRNSKTIESFLLEMAAAPSEHESSFPLPPLGLESVTFPSAPQLKHLTIFQLEGPSSDEAAEEVLETQGEPACQLRSLHIRRVRWIDYENLKFIVANSHRTLKKLTWVFESPVSIRRSHPAFDRGVLSNFAVHDAFLPCTEIETLRVGDMVYDPPPPTGPTAARNSPLSLILDGLISGMKKLTTLDICGTITTPELYDRHREDIPFPLTSLTIQRHPHFRLYQLLYQLRRGEGPLSMLRHLTLDQQIQADVHAAEWEMLQRVCRARHVQLRVQVDDPFSNIPGNKLSGLVGQMTLDPT
ncbi:hypothetical protein PCANC_00207 [Puccinia coronata f. sp. avenae]|uniref:F-box domain-containing protein n=1 Tax=Puccinia coronata f. sp. avenae TaxID=200324 RepID=A0A2N5W8H6_9BASI|nr:hypothetical protein PCASD_21050 [Puccinia coronata f. sp. avenae]PLW18807.1 hypothetical protein PCANC_06652 [Puccinia coronata f. sp. avenae]PLW33675.1 hypothetical protein PCASD_10321 [Puccinia coronata f. sp. avenae]PLW58498.1 hypothetical protein PCANC_00207 [Puccinia coronata f. sp. avenae]